MADEVYEGAIGIDLGKWTIFSISDIEGHNFSFVKIFKSFAILQYQQRKLIYFTTNRNHLLVCCQLRGNQCRDQYVFPFSRTRHPISQVGLRYLESYTDGFCQLPTSKVASPPHLSFPSPTRSVWSVSLLRTMLPWTQRTPSSISSQYLNFGDDDEVLTNAQAFDRKKIRWPTHHKGTYMILRHYDPQCSKLWISQH